MVTDVEKFKAVQTLLMHRLITKEDLNAMRVNRVFGEDKSTEPSGVVRVKLFCGSSTWLLSEFDEKNGLFFGLCDLGHGCPELGRFKKFVSFQNQPFTPVTPVID